MNGRSPEFDVIVVGGGPAGSILASLLAQRGRSCLVLERDIHPRDHVGESLTPSTNPIFSQIGFLEKMEAAGFVHKPGACWTAPRSPAGKFVAIRLGEFPPPGATQLYTYNVERDEFDAMLIRHAHELGARVLQGVGAHQVLFHGDRAVGVRAKLADGVQHDFSGRFVIDASGRRCVLANQLGFKHRDPEFDQVAMYSWFRGSHQTRRGTRAFCSCISWAWSGPGRGRSRCATASARSVWSPTAQTSSKPRKARTSSSPRWWGGASPSARSWSGPSASVPGGWRAGYSYRIDRISGPGWLIIGDALRFIDPVFSTGVDVAAYSATFAFDAIQQALSGADEPAEWARYENRVSGGVDVWYQFTSLFYRLQNLFTLFAVRDRIASRSCGSCRAIPTFRSRSSGRAR